MFIIINISNYKKINYKKTNISEIIKISIMIQDPMLSRVNPNFFKKD